VTSGARAKGSGDASPPITTLLAAARAGDRAASDDVFALVYAQLRRLASRQPLRGGTLSTTALVHEVYLKLGGDGTVVANDRVHFFSLAARAMRQILIDRARHGGRGKRGGGVRALSLDGLPEPSRSEGEIGREEMLTLDRALARLAVVDTELEQLVEWRFFAGLTIEEIAALTGTSERSLKRSWAVARLFLLREMRGDPPAGAP
jgi:RNA polymerase sigma factor (TIGR02999 family)